MRFVVQKAPLRRMLKWGQRGFFACAVLLLGYCAFALVDAWIFQRRESRELDRLLRDRQVASQGTPQPGLSTAPKSAPAAAVDGLIGRIEIPRLLLSAWSSKGSTKPLSGARSDIFPARRCRDIPATWAWPGTGTRSFVR